MSFMVAIGKVLKVTPLKCIGQFNHLGHFKNKMSRKVERAVLFLTIGYKINKGSVEHWIRVLTVLR